MAGYSARYYPELLVGSDGESNGKGDTEYALFARLKQGVQPPPSKHAREVMELAMQMAGPRFLEDGGPTSNGNDAHDNFGGRVLEDPDDPFSDVVPFAAKLGHTENSCPQQSPSTLHRRSTITNGSGTTSPQVCHPLAGTVQ